MKNTFVILFLLYFLTGCNKQQLTHKETVAKYYNARDTGKYNELKTFISDSITIIEGDYVMPYDHDSFYEQFKWDSIFKTSYEIVELEEKNNQIVASVTMNSVRNEFLKNNNMTCEYKISFNSGKISKIEELKCLNVDWNIWQKERDSLTSWIKKNHPELDGFINDMTMNGSMNYLKAIELYKTRVDQTVYEMWKSFIESKPESNDDEMPESWFFHNNEKDANRLAELIASGKKKAGSGLYSWYEEANADLPKIGTKHIITDFDGKARAIIEIKKVDTIPFNQISEEYAEMDMGTSEDPLKKWRKAHWDFFSRAMAEGDQKPTENILVVCEQFETIWPEKP